MSGAQRFFRPADVSGLRRNQRRIAASRVFALARGLALAAAVAGGGLWIWSHTRSDARYAIRRVHVDGAVHTPRAAIDVVTGRYVGTNLFEVDLARLRKDLGSLGWVERVDIEKAIPDALRIRIVEREPVALVRTGDRLLYVDDDGTAFAALSPAVGDDDLPVIVEANGPELRRTVLLLRALQRTDPEIYSRISEVRPIPPRGFAIFDRELRAVVYGNSEDLAPKWRDLYAILLAEGRGRIAYADLRFADRIIVKPGDEAIPGDAGRGSAASVAAGPIAGTRL